MNGERAIKASALFDIKGDLVIRHMSEWHEVKGVGEIVKGRGKQKKIIVCVYTPDMRLWTDGEQTVIIREVKA